MTFQVEGDEDQVIVSNFIDVGEPFREISASSKEIRIWGAKTKSSYIPIEHVTKKHEWTTVFVEWSNIDDNRGSFIINNRETTGVFTCADLAPWTETYEITIGGRYGDTPRSLKGAISSLELYIAENAPEDGLPDAIVNLIISRQLIKIHEEPSTKKKKKKE